MRWCELAVPFGVKTPCGPLACATHQTGWIAWHTSHAQPQPSLANPQHTQARGTAANSRPLACTTDPEGWNSVEESSLTDSWRARLARLKAPG